GAEIADRLAASLSFGFIFLDLSGRALGAVGRLGQVGRTDCGTALEHAARKHVDWLHHVLGQPANWRGAKPGLARLELVARQAKLGPDGLSAGGSGTGSRGDRGRTAA